MPGLGPGDSEWETALELTRSFSPSGGDRWNNHTLACGGKCCGEEAAGRVGAECGEVLLLWTVAWELFLNRNICTETWLK